MRAEGVSVLQFIKLQCNYRRMKSVVLCGSRRFKTDIREFGRKLKEAGVIVYEPYLYEIKDGWNQLSAKNKNFVVLGLTHDHFQKIRTADVVYIYNKDGYSGVSTTLEIGCAVALSKPIYAFAKDPSELCRNVLFRDFISSPEELLIKLK